MDAEDTNRYLDYDDNRSNGRAPTMGARFTCTLVS